jgi:hypothetical protein
MKGTITRFEPALYSIEENLFMAEHLGESPNVALNKGTPVNVNPKAVRPVLQRVFELIELEKHEGEAWIGVEALKSSIVTYVDSIHEWERDKRKGAPYPPTVYEWDTRGRARMHGVGSDAHMVKTYFDENGARKELGVPLSGGIGAKYIPEWARRKAAAHRVNTDLVIDMDNGKMACPVCQYTVNFNKDDHSKLNIAKAQMAKHMKSDRKNPDDHRVAYGTIFGAGDREVN